MRTNHVLTSIGVAVLLAAAACGNDGINSDEEARRAYIGLDPSISQSLTLGFAGFNSASSANISPQMGTGAGAGTITITGQVDHGTSPNKEMRLYVGMVGYSQGEFEVVYNGDQHVKVDLTYDTDAVMANQPYLHLSLRDVPTGTFTGELTGTYHVTGDIAGDMTLNLMFSGKLMDLGNMMTDRVPGMTMVTGTATTGDGNYDVSLTI